MIYVYKSEIKSCSCSSSSSRSDKKLTLKQSQAAAVLEGIGRRLHVVKPVSERATIMKKEELIFAMSEDTNDYLDETPSRHFGNESDEGCCIITDPLSGNIVRRVKSTPNLLQIPSPKRNRKKSDDSAVGSAEESESDKSNDSSPPCEVQMAERVAKFHTSSTLSPEDVPAMTLTVQGNPGLLRPPSVIVSDHDLCLEEGETYITLDDLDAEYNRSHSRRRLSDCSDCSSLSFSELDDNTNSADASPCEEEAEEASNFKASRWRTIRTIVHQLTPFIQTYKKQRYLWVQLAGHQGNFKAGWQQGTILKKFCPREQEAFEILMNDALKPYVPQYYGIVKDGEENEYLQLEDLLGQFNNPCVMDCKLGVRTYLEEELMKAKEKPKLRKDMYEKMLQIDPNAPLPEEHQLRGVTKPRYMVWRETISTTATMGFRIEGIRKSDGTSSKDFKTIRSEEMVKDAFSSFVDGFSDAIPKYLDRLYTLRDTLKQSQFFSSHEVIGSSLLFVHDSTKASLWMIDFAKTCPLPEVIPPINHDKPWALGNHEDGYLIGLSNLIKVFEEILQK